MAPTLLPGPVLASSSVTSSSCSDVAAILEWCGGDRGESKAAVQETARLEGELGRAPVAGISCGWKELLWMEGAPISIPSKKKVHGDCAALGYAGDRVGGSSHSGAVTRTHRLPTRPTPLLSAFAALFSACPGGNWLLRHLCTFQHNEPLSGAFTHSRTKAQGSHRQEPWCCNTIVLSQVISAKNKLLLNNLQNRFHQTLQGGRPSRALTQGTNSFRNSEEFNFFLSLLRVSLPKPSHDPLSLSSTLKHL